MKEKLDMTTQSLNFCIYMQYAVMFYELFVIYLLKNQQPKFEIFAIQQLLLFSDIGVTIYCTTHYQSFWGAKNQIQKAAYFVRRFLMFVVFLRIMFFYVTIYSYKIEQVDSVRQQQAVICLMILTCYSIIFSPLQSTYTLLLLVFLMISIFVFNLFATKHLIHAFGLILSMLSTPILNMIINNVQDSPIYQIHRTVKIMNRMASTLVTAFVNALPSRILPLILKNSKLPCDIVNNVSFCYLNLKIDDNKLKDLNSNEAKIYLSRINHFYCLLDFLSDTIGIQKIKSSQSYYLCCVGAQAALDGFQGQKMESNYMNLHDQAKLLFTFCLASQEAAKMMDLQCSCGITKGQLVVGVLGIQGDNINFDTYGDIVNTAARIAKNADEGVFVKTDDFLISNHVDNQDKSFVFERDGYLEQFMNNQSIFNKSRDLILKSAPCYYFNERIVKHYKGKGEIASTQIHPSSIFNIMLRQAFIRAFHSIVNQFILERNQDEDDSSSNIDNQIVDQFDDLDDTSQLSSSIIDSSESTLYGSMFNDSVTTFQIEYDVVSDRSDRIGQQTSKSSSKTNLIQENESDTLYLDGIQLMQQIKNKLSSQYSQESSSLDDFPKQLKEVKSYFPEDFENRSLSRSFKYNNSLKQQATESKRKSRILHQENLISLRQVMYDDQDMNNLIQAINTRNTTMNESQQVFHDGMTNKLSILFENSLNVSQEDAKLQKVQDSVSHVSNKDTLIQIQSQKLVSSSLAPEKHDSESSKTTTDTHGSQCTNSESRGPELKSALQSFLNVATISNKIRKQEQKKKQKYETVFEDPDNEKGASFESQISQHSSKRLFHLNRSDSDMNQQRVDSSFGTQMSIKSIDSADFSIPTLQNNLITNQDASQASLHGQPSDNKISQERVVQSSTIFINSMLNDGKEESLLVNELFRKLPDVEIKAEQQSQPFKDIFDIFSYTQNKGIFGNLFNLIITNIRFFMNISEYTKKRLLEDHQFISVLLSVQRSNYFSIDLIIFTLQLVIYLVLDYLKPISIMKVELVFFRFNVRTTIKAVAIIQFVSSLLFNIYKLNWFKKFSSELMLFTKTKWNIEVKRLMNQVIVGANAFYITMTLGLHFFKITLFIIAIQDFTVYEEFYLDIRKLHTYYIADMFNTVLIVLFNLHYATTPIIFLSTNLQFILMVSFLYICLQSVIDPFQMLVVTVLTIVSMLYVIPVTKVFFQNTITNRKITNQINQGRQLLKNILPQITIDSLLASSSPEVLKQMISQFTFLQKFQNRIVQLLPFRYIVGVEYGIKDYRELLKEVDLSLDGQSKLSKEDAKKYLEYKLFNQFRKFLSFQSPKQLGAQRPVINFENVSYLNLDVQNFTLFSSTDNHTVEQVMNFLQQMFDLFDERIKRSKSLIQVKISGDCYELMSLPVELKTYEENEKRSQLSAFHQLSPQEQLLLQSYDALVLLISVGLGFIQDCQQVLSEFHPTWKDKVGLRVGISYGNVVGSLLGQKLCRFDTFGQTTNEAESFQSATNRNTVGLSEAALCLLNNGKKLFQQTLLSTISDQKALGGKTLDWQNEYADFELINGNMVVGIQHINPDGKI